MMMNAESENVSVETSIEKSEGSKLVLRFFEFAYITIVVEMLLLFVMSMKIADFATFVFAAASLVSYPVIYLAPAILATVLVASILHLIKRIPQKLKSVVIATVMIAATVGIQLFLFADHKLLKMFGFHFNGFVWNLITTPGGLKSMEAGNDIYFYLILLVMAFIGFDLIVLWVSKKSLNIKCLSMKGEITAVIVCFLLIVFSGFCEKMLFGYAYYKGTPSIFNASKRIPFYIPATYSRLAMKLGIKPGRKDKLTVAPKQSSMNYPLQKIEFKKPEKPLNIVWLVSESWRADTLTPEIMPATTAFAKKAWFFKNHYSSGNGTRMGMFGMFYGLYGSYWFSALSEGKSPILMRVLKKEGYQFEMYTSANFHYPEMEKTIFLNIPRDRLLGDEGHDGWVDDRTNITSMLNFITNRDRKRPFMAFMFFLSPHAPYTFPDECVIRKNYLPHVNYATIDAAKDIQLIKNRYINAVRHLDTQLKRVFDYLEKEDLMKNTIVIVTGDHGEEFMEAGHWGHNSGFHQGEIKPPLVIYVPGKGAKTYDGISSHLDIPATIAPLIGIKNNPSDYSFGHDLFSGKRRKYTVVADWDDLCYVDDKYKYTIPSKYTLLAKNLLVSKDDAPIKDKSAFFETRRKSLGQLMSEVNRFYKH